MLRSIRDFFKIFYEGSDFLVAHHEHYCSQFFGSEENKRLFFLELKLYAPAEAKLSLKFPCCEEAGPRPNVLGVKKEENLIFCQESG